MSADPGWTLADQVRAFVAGVEAAEPASALRMRRIVGGETALIAVDEETVLVRFRGERLVVTAIADEAGDAQADGVGATDRGTVLDLLAARIELTDAVLTDRLRLAGAPRSIVRICQAIEILLDVAVRAPGLQALADRYRRGSPPGAPGGAGASRRRPGSVTPAAELELLARLGLLGGER